VRGVGSSNLPVPTIKIIDLQESANPFNTNRGEKSGNLRPFRGFTSAAEVSSTVSAELATSRQNPSV
jgi:hypothetical protein